MLARRSGSDWWRKWAQGGKSIKKHLFVCCTQTFYEYNMKLYKVIMKECFVSTNYMNEIFENNLEKLSFLVVFVSWFISDVMS